MLSETVNRIEIPQQGGTAVQVAPDNPRPLNEQIFVQREALGMTPKELAAKAGVSRQAINQYESGQCRPSAEVLARLSAALGATLVPPTLTPTEESKMRRPNPPKPARRTAALRTDPMPDPRPGRRLSLEEARALHPVAEPKRKGWPTAEEIAAACAQVREGNAAMECGAYVRLFAMERTGRRGDLIEYRVVIGTSRAVEAEEVLLALRTALGDPRGHLDALEAAS